MKVRVTSLDMNGLCGREHHPERTDAGRVGVVVGAEVDTTIAKDIDDAGHPIGDPVEHLVIFTVALDGDIDRVVELAEYEIEVAS